MERNNNRGQLIFNEFTSHYPYISNEIIRWRESGLFEITLMDDDGRIHIYNSLDHSIITFSPIHINDIDEQACRDIIGKRIETILFDAQMSQDELADKIGVSQSMISNYIKGRSSVSILILCRIVKATGRKIEDFTDVLYF